MNREVYNSSFNYVIETNKEDGCITQAGRILNKIDDETILIEGYNALHISFGDVPDIGEPAAVLEDVYELDFDYEHREYYFFKTRQAFIGCCLRGKKNQ